MKVWILKYSCCRDDIQLFGSKKKAVNSMLNIINDYEPHSVEDMGDFVEVLSLKTADCLVRIHKQEVE